MELSKSEFPFSKWTFQAVVERFRLTILGKTAAVREWTDVSGTVPDWALPVIERIQNRLVRHVHDWHESDFRADVMSPLLLLINFSGEGFNYFNDRNITAVVDGENLYGSVDWVSASGHFAPIAPYFFIHEYTAARQADSAPSSDPYGQVLAAMVAARSLNGDDLPVYGCVVIAASWRFLILDGNGFAESSTYDFADETDVVKIWLILTKAKEYIEKRVKSKVGDNKLFADS